MADKLQGFKSVADGRIRKMGWPFAAAAVVFFALGAGGWLPPALAFLGFAMVAGSVLLANRPAQQPSSQRALADTTGAEAVSLPSVIYALPDAALAIDHQEAVLAFNRAAGRLAPALRIGEPLTRAWRAPSLLSAVRLAVTSGQAQRVEFSEHVPADRWFEVHVIHVSAASRERKRPSVLLLTFHDLSPLRRVEEMRADFVANASHELRTPLATLSGFIETLQGPARNDAQARDRFLGIMQTQATRMARLIDDLLSLSRIEFNAHLRPDKQVNIAAIVRQVADSLQTLARDRGVQVTVAMPAENILVRGDRDELIRVFENLLENALKYAASGKRVEVTLTIDEAAKPAPELRVAVRDYGPGIAPEHLPRLTERFYRVDVVQSRAEGGTGLGLALVKHILNRHGGKLSIESERGHGATFTTHLPFALSDRENQTQSAG